MMNEEKCGVCGGDGRITNSFSGSDARCPACLGSGRKSLDTGFRDVTKTKPSHHKKPTAQGAPSKPEGPTSPLGQVLADEVKAAALSNETKSKLTREIMDHEATHGTCTQTFTKKLRKQLRG